jgi:hypothetical protein
MSFWKRRKQSSDQAPAAGDTGQVQKAKKSVKRSPPLAMEVKILALEALDSGPSAIEVGELVGLGSGTIHKWRKDYADGGVQGPAGANPAGHLQRRPAPRASLNAQRPLLTTRASSRCLGSKGADSVLRAVDVQRRRKGETIKPNRAIRGDLAPLMACEVTDYFYVDASEPREAVV